MFTFFLIGLLVTNRVLIGECVVIATVEDSTGDTLDLLGDESTEAEFPGDLSTLGKVTNNRYYPFFDR